MKLKYLWRRSLRRLRWSVARRVIREELESFADAGYASWQAKVGGDLKLSRDILGWADSYESRRIEVEFLAAKSTRPPKEPAL